jgi:hypothetical protein
MLCPLRKAVEHNLNYDHIDLNPYFGKCYETKCAWWDEEHKNCVIHNLTSLNLIAWILDHK